MEHNSNTITNENTFATKKSNGIKFDIFEKAKKKSFDNFEALNTFKKQQANITNLALTKK